MTNTKQTWTNPNRSFPPGGAWDAEPDKQQWVDEATGLDCLAVRNPSGTWCGYVGVPTTHPVFGKYYSDPIPELTALHGKRMESKMPETPDMNLMIAALGGKLDELNMGTSIEVHGGVTFTGACAKHVEDEPWRYVCHVPRTGHGEVWWVGFDCAHCDDLVPGMRFGMPASGVYRDLRYVEAQCARLARQLAEVAP